MSTKLRSVFFRNPFSQGLGLMFRKPQPDTLYVFNFSREVKLSFHMLFVFWSIDLYLLDKKGSIVEMQKDFWPFTTYRPRKHFWYAIETVPGLLKKRIGEKIRFTSQ
ncbi:DUF192 domain-containing protein [Candidatus Woesearchaeota archaeon]|nr:DUF192 domain-containing protein [Candidatus Woesearchaeota archaeon]